MPVKNIESNTSLSFSSSYCSAGIVQLFNLSVSNIDITSTSSYVQLYSPPATAAGASRPSSVPRPDGLLQLLGGCYSTSNYYLAQGWTTIRPGWDSHVGPALWWDCVLVKVCPFPEFMNKFILYLMLFYIGISW